MIDLIDIATKVRYRFFVPGARADGRCYTVSKALLAELRALGLTQARLVENHFCGGTHTWVEVDGFVIDLTGDQFDTGMPPVFIGSRKEHQSFNHEPEH